MQPFQQATMPSYTIKELMEKFDITVRQATAYLMYRADSQTFMNDTYQVVAQDKGDHWHLSIKRNDKECIHDWRDLQEIKNMICGPECEGLELYPAESRRVDSANQYHLWVLKRGQIPFGFQERLVLDTGNVEKCGGKQRKL
jgi:hypothetical protein